MNDSTKPIPVYDVFPKEITFPCVTAFIFPSAPPTHRWQWIWMDGLGRITVGYGITQDECIRAIREREQTV